MQDEPSAAEILGAVIDFLRREVMPQLSGSTGFTTRVAANALEIVQRECLAGAAANAAEAARLAALLGEDGDADRLNREMCRRIDAGAVSLATPGLAAHLRATALEKLAIDQPNYATYRAVLEKGWECPGREHTA